jgi:hypothetical protein
MATSLRFAFTAKGPPELFLQAIKIFPDATRR